MLKLNDMEFKKQYQVKISNRFKALSKFDANNGDGDDVDINRAQYKYLTEYKTFSYIQSSLL